MPIPESEMTTRTRPDSRSSIDTVSGAWHFSSSGAFPFTNVWLWGSNFSESSNPPI